MNKVSFGNDARLKIVEGIDIVSNAVKATLGPRGRNAIIQKSYGSPLITNDGVTVAKEIDLKDNYQKIGAELIKEVAQKTNEGAGDGTSTATVLAQAIIKEGLINVSAGANPMMIKAGIDKAKDFAVDYLKKNTKEINSNQEIEQVGTISAQSEEVGKKIARAMEKVSKNGVISVEEGNTFGINLKVVEGAKIDKGYKSPYMVTDSETLKSELKDPYILITDHKITSIKQILNLIEQVVESGKKELVIIAEDIDGEALTSLILNKVRGVFNPLAISAPGFGDNKKDILNDLAILTGAKYITSDLDMKLEDVTIDMLGKAAKVVATKDDTTIIDAKGDKSQIEEKANDIRSKIKKETSSYEKDKLQQRLARLSGGVAVLEIGAATEVEVKEKKLRIEDALNATRAAVEEGIIAGGGTLLTKISRELEGLKGDNDEENIGIDIVRRSLVYPLHFIAQNSGKSGEVVVNKVKENDNIHYGYNAKTDEYTDMIKEGIIDPTKVTRSALENAISVASMFLTTEVVVADEEKEDKGADMPAMGGMPGMM